MSDCCLKNTLWLNELIIDSGTNISFNPELSSLIQPFDNNFSGIWRPIIINNKKYQNNNDIYIMPKIDTAGTGYTTLYSIYDEKESKYRDDKNNLIGFQNFCSVSNYKLQNWNKTQGELNISADIGMDLFNSFYYIGQKENNLSFPISEFTNNSGVLTGYSPQLPNDNLISANFNPELNSCNVIKTSGTINQNGVTSITIENKKYRYNYTSAKQIDIVMDNMLSFKKINNQYHWFFDSSPYNFSFLNPGISNKELALIFDIRLYKASGISETKTCLFKITGQGKTLSEINNKDQSKMFADYIMGWYRYYDMGRRNDKRYLPGVDFYFGDIDTFLFYGKPEFLFPQIDSKVPIPSGIEFSKSIPGKSDDVGSGRLLFNTINNKIIAQNLDQYFNNKYEKQYALSVLKTSPYFDMVSQDLTDMDYYCYSRDSYGRIIPFLSGMSIKSYKDMNSNRYVGTKSEIFYRLAEKYGLKVIVSGSSPITIESKFKSKTGNISIVQNNLLVQNTGTIGLPFVNTKIIMNDIEYTKELLDKKLDLTEMKNSPVVPPFTTIATAWDNFYFLNPNLSFSSCGAILCNASGYDLNNYYYYILNSRLNNQILKQAYIHNNLENKYIRLCYSYFTNNINLKTHGHNGIIDNSFSRQDRSTIGFSRSGIISENTIENSGVNGSGIGIKLTYEAKNNAKLELGNIELSYLRSPSKPKCPPFISQNSTPNSKNSAIVYDHKNNAYYIGGTYVPPVTTFYLPSGSYYGDLENSIVDSVNIKFQNHPTGTLLKTHSLFKVDPIKSFSGYKPQLLYNLSLNGNNELSLPMKNLYPGFVHVGFITSSGKMDFSLSGNPTFSTSSSLQNTNISGLLTYYPSIDSPELISGVASITVDKYCDNSSLKIYHTPFERLYVPLFYTIEASGNIGFFHPNSGWIYTNSEDTNKYRFKTPMAPYAPSPMESHQQELEDNKEIRPEHYFWYDCEKMYNGQFLDGFNLIIDTSGMNSVKKELINKSRYIGFKYRNGYIITKDFYRFQYNENKSPIKKSIKMSYIDIDYTYGYPFNDFTYYLANPDNKSRIVVNSYSSNDRTFSYFDDSIYQTESVSLFKNRNDFILNSGAFTTTISSTSGNNQVLFLTLNSSIPNGYENGLIKKNKTNNKSESVLIYRSNITMNDSEIDIGKWGNIIAGKHPSIFDNSVVRKKAWPQCSLFLNQNNLGQITSSGYYTPYSYADTVYTSGLRNYKIIGGENDFGRISYIKTILPSYIYLGPYTGQMHITSSGRFNNTQNIKFAPDNSCLGSTSIKNANGNTVSKTFNKEESTPIFYELNYSIKNLKPYYIEPINYYFNLVSPGSGSYKSFYKYDSAPLSMLGITSGEFFSYIGDISSKNELKQKNRCSFYNHNTNTKSKNPYLDMNIFSNDAKYQPTFNENSPVPSGSGFVYFEGLIEPPLSSFYSSGIITRYNSNKIWIDIPQNAKLGMMTPKGKVFWSDTTYWLHKSYKVNCDNNLRICNEQKAKSTCDEVLSINSPDELLEILDLSSDLFSIETINIPSNCSDVTFCCDSMIDINAFNKTCDADLTTAKAKCSNLLLKIFPKITANCLNHHCPRASGIDPFGFEYKSLKEFNVQGSNFIKGTGIIENISAIIFKPKKFIFKDNQNNSNINYSKPYFIDTNDNNGFGLIPSGISFLDDPYSDFNSQNIDNLIYNVPTGTMGFMVVESGIRNSGWLNKHCSLDSIKPADSYYFKEINHQESKFFDIKPIDINTIWKNEILYRNFIHSNITGLLGEYDVKSYGSSNNNKYEIYDIRPSIIFPYISGDPNCPYPLSTLHRCYSTSQSYPICQEIATMKDYCFGIGTLFNVIILENDTTEAGRIVVSVENYDDGPCLKYNVFNKKKLVFHTSENNYTLGSYMTEKGNCDTFSRKTPKQVTLPKNMTNKKVLSIENLKFSNLTDLCSGVYCPEDFKYCEDIKYYGKIIHGNIDPRHCVPDPPELQQFWWAENCDGPCEKDSSVSIGNIGPCDIKGFPMTETANQTANIIKKRSRNSCLQDVNDGKLTVFGYSEDPLPGCNFGYFQGYAKFPENYFYIKGNSEVWWNYKNNGYNNQLCAKKITQSDDNISFKNINLIVTQDKIIATIEGYNIPIYINRNPLSLFPMIKVEMLHKNIQLL